MIQDVCNVYRICTVCFLWKVSSVSYVLRDRECTGPWRDSFLDTCCMLKIFFLLLHGDENLKPSLLVYAYLIKQNYFNYFQKNYVKKPWCLSLIIHYGALIDCFKRGVWFKSLYSSKIMAGFDKRLLLRGINSPPQKAFPVLRQVVGTRGHSDKNKVVLQFIRTLYSILHHIL